MSAHEDPAQAPPASAPAHTPPSEADDADAADLVNRIEALDTSDPQDDEAGLGGSGGAGGAIDAGLGAGHDAQPHSQGGVHAQWPTPGGFARQARPPPFMPSPGGLPPNALPLPGLGIGNLPPQLALNMAYTAAPLGGPGAGISIGMGSVVNGTGVPGQPGSVPVSVTNAYAAQVAAQAQLQAFAGGDQADPAVAAQGQAQAQTLSLPGIAVNAAGELPATPSSANGFGANGHGHGLAPASAQYAHAGNNYLHRGFSRGPHGGLAAPPGAGGQLSAGPMGLGMGMHGGMHGNGHGHGHGGPSSAPAHGGGFYGMNGAGYGMGIPPSPLPPGGMDPASMTGNYGPAAAAAAAAAAGNQTGRTVYVGNLPADASVDELMNLVRFGPVESVRLLPEKSCVFISFLDGATAAAFHADATVKKLTLHGQELKIGWGKPSLVMPHIVQAIAQHKATRNVYVGGLDEDLSESALRDDLSRFGPIDQVKIVRDKSIGFVHFLSIQAAMKVVASLPSEEAWRGKRVGYGKDRCAYVPRAQQAAVAAAQQQAAAALGHQVGMPGSPFTAFSPQSPATLYTYGSPRFPHFTGSPNSAGFSPHMNDPLSLADRCVYIGQLADEATPEDICNAVKGGQILQLKFLPQRHIAFVTFVEIGAAQAFHSLATIHGLLIAGKRVKVGWGKQLGKVHPSLLTAIQAGASRNVYIGGITDFEEYSEARLRGDLSIYGEIEQINFLRDKKAAFVNFFSVVSATRAIEGLKPNPAYSDFRIAYGKDRCSNMPRPGHFGTNPRSRGPSAVTSPAAVPEQSNPFPELVSPGSQDSAKEMTPEKA